MSSWRWRWRTYIVRVESSRVERSGAEGEASEQLELERPSALESISKHYSSSASSSSPQSSPSLRASHVRREDWRGEGSAKRSEALSERVTSQNRRRSARRGSANDRRVLYLHSSRCDAPRRAALYQRLIRSQFISNVLYTTV